MVSKSLLFFDNNITLVAVLTLYMQHSNYKKMKYKIETCIGSRLRSLSRRVDNIYRKHLEGHNITENQMSIIMALSKTGKIEQIQIGRILNLERSSLSRNLVRLIEQNYVQKEGASNRPQISLTKKGLKKSESMMPAWEKAMDEVYAMLDNKSIAGFNQFEKQLSTN